jgi:hypothetical protein
MGLARVMAAKHQIAKGLLAEISKQRGYLIIAGFYSSSISILSILGLHSAKVDGLLSCLFVRVYGGCWRGRSIITLTQGGAR